jgi:hypothetical protein
MMFIMITEEINTSSWGCKFMVGMTHEIHEQYSGPPGTMMIHSKHDSQGRDLESL